MPKPFMYYSSLNFDVKKLEWNMQKWLKQTPNNLYIRQSKSYLISQSSSIGVWIWKFVKLEWCARLLQPPLIFVKELWFTLALQQKKLERFSSCHTQVAYHTRMWIWGKRWLLYRVPITLSFVSCSQIWLIPLNHQL